MQEKAHCNSVSFDGSAANVFQDYVANTLGFGIKRAGLLYGTVSADGGVRAEFIYEPPQEGTPDDVSLLPNEDEQVRVDAIAENVGGMHCVGWIFSQSKPGDHIVSSAEIKQMATLQGQSKDKTFVTAIVKRDPETNSVHFEAFQVSDQCVTLNKGGVLGDPDPTTPGQTFTTKPGESED